MAGREITVYRDFRRGLNVDVAPHLLDDTELVVAKNIELGLRGALRTRKGVVRLNQTSYGAPVTQLFEWPRDDGSVWLMAVVGNKLCRIDPATGSKTDVATVARPTVGYFVFQDKLYFVDGNGFYVYNGTTTVAVTPKDHPENDMTPIRRCTMLVRHPKSFRFFAAGDPQHRSTLYYSEPNEPDFWKGTSKLVPSQADGAITGLALLADAVLVFFANAVWVWRGIDPDEDVIWERLSAPEGTAAPGSIALTPMSMTFLGAGGLWVMSPSALGLSGEIRSDGQAFINVSDNRVNSLLASITQRDKVAAAYDARRQKYLLTFTTKATGGNDRILEYDWSLGSFVLHEGIPAHSLLYTQAGDTLAGIDGYVLRLNDGNLDFDGIPQPIAMEVLTPPYNPAPMTPKQFQRLLVTFSKTSEQMSLPCDVIVDGATVLSIDLAQYVDTPAHTDIVTARVPMHVNGESLQLRFAVEQLDPVTLYAWAFEWVPLWRKGKQI
ncbi:MAG: hypothetical protein FWJ65_11830 [Limnochordales bacterium]